MWIEKIHEPVDEVLTDEDVYLEDINRIHRRVCMLQCCLCEPEKMWDFGEEMSKLVKEMERRICLLDFEGKNVNSLVIERIITKFYEKMALLYLLREGIITLLMTMEDRLEILHEEVVFSGGINVDKTAEHLYRLKVLVAVIGKLLLRLRGYLDKLPRGNWPITGRRNKEREELTLLREQMMLMDITLEEKDAGKQDMLRKKKKKNNKTPVYTSRGVRDKALTRGSRHNKIPSSKIDICLVGTNKTSAAGNLVKRKRVLKKKESGEEEKEKAESVVEDSALVEKKEEKKKRKRVSKKEDSGEAEIEIIDSGIDVKKKKKNR